MLRAMILDGLALLTLFIFLGYETIRFRELHATCVRTQGENALLLQNVLCKDAWQRSLHGPKQEQLCQAAAEENARTPYECAWRALWTQGELHQLWVRISTSYWLMFGVGAPVLCTVVIMWFHNRNQAAARKDQQRLFEEMARALRPPPREGEDRSLFLDAPQGARVRKHKHHHHTLMAQPTYYVAPPPPPPFPTRSSESYVELVHV
jgi:hypothetical protein